MEQDTSNNSVTGCGLTFYLLLIAQYNQISFKRFLIAGRGNLYIKNTGRGAIWVEKPCFRYTKIIQLWHKIVKNLKHLFLT